VSEYELSRRGINPFSTPGSMDEITGWKGWMKTGFNLYSKLEELAKQIVVTICSCTPGVLMSERICYL